MDQEINLYDRQVRALGRDFSRVIQGLKILCVGDSLIISEIAKHFVLLGVKIVYV